MYVGTCRNEGCPLVISVGVRLGGKVSAMCWSILCRSATGKTWGDSMPEVAASM